MQPNVIETHLETLRLKGMLDAWVSQPHRELVSADQWSAFVLELLESELSHRQARSYAYRLTLAQLPQIKKMDTFDARVLPMKAGMIEALQTCQFIEAHENVLLIGGSGTGKTHLALALAHLALQQRYRVRFYKFNELARALLTAQAHHTESRFMARLMRFQVLVIDELGYLPIDPQAGSLVFELLSGFYEKGSLIITTHLSFEEWADVLGHKKLSKTLIDRITHHCHLVETGNESWRLKEVKAEKKA